MYQQQKALRVHSERLLAYFSDHDSLLPIERLVERQVELATDAGVGGVAPLPLGIGGELDRNPTIGDGLIIVLSSSRCVVAAD